MFLMLFSSFFIAANEPSKSLLSEKIEVQVGTEIITTTDIQMMEDVLKSESADDIAPSDLRSKARDVLVDQALMSLYLQQVNYPVTDKDVDQRINSIRTSNGIKSDLEFKALLESRGMSFDKFRTQIRLQMEKAQFVNVLRQSTARTIDKKDLLAYFKNNPSEFKKNFQAELTECLIPYGADSKDSQKRAEFFVNHPNKFGDCVKDLSKSASAQRSGHLGTFTWGSLPEAVETKIINLKAGEVAVIKQPTGIQLLKVAKIKSLGPVTFEAAEERIREHLESVALDTEIKKTLAERRTNSVIKIKS